MNQIKAEQKRVSIFKHKINTWNMEKITFEKVITELTERLKEYE